MSSVVISGDTSGSVTLQAPATAGSTTLTLPAVSGTVLTTASTTGINGTAVSTGVVGEAYGGTGTTTGYYGFKNRIINGGMAIDQRNAGAQITPAAGAYLVDRFQYDASQSNKFNSQQNPGGAGFATGFRKYLGLTVASAYSITSTDYFHLIHKIEGNNIGDLFWGTSNASAVTLSFRIYSSLTGTFGGSIRNGSYDRSYPFTFTINSANTWETKTITIPGDTAGTWAFDNSLGLVVAWGLGNGSNYTGPAGAWAGANYQSATGAQSVVGTAGATFYITGVQLEKGSTTTSFDYRSYGTELQLCQRYYQNLGNVGVSALSATGVIGFLFPTPMRATPTITFSYNGTSNAIYRFSDAAVSTLSSPTIIATSFGMQNMYAFSPASWASTPGYGYQAAFVLNAEL